MRLRYEIRREIAPYIGFAWVRQFGATADLARASGENTSDLQALAGVRFWF
jgi:copper resistance protein B